MFSSVARLSLRLLGTMPNHQAIEKASTGRKEDQKACKAEAVEYYADIEAILRSAAAEVNEFNQQQDLRRSVLELRASLQVQLVSLDELLFARFLRDKFRWNTRNNRKLVPPRIHRSVMVSYRRRGRGAVPCGLMQQRMLPRRISTLRSCTHLMLMIFFSEIRACSGAELCRTNRGAGMALALRVSALGTANI